MSSRSSRPWRRFSARAVSTSCTGPAWAASAAARTRSTASAEVVDGSSRSPVKSSIEQPARPAASASRDGLGHAGGVVGEAVLEVGRHRHVDGGGQTRRRARAPRRGRRRRRAGPAWPRTRCSSWRAPRSRATRAASPSRRPTGSASAAARPRVQGEEPSGLLLERRHGLGFFANPAGRFVSGIPRPNRGRKPEAWAIVRGHGPSHPVRSCTHGSIAERWKRCGTGSWPGGVRPPARRCRAFEGKGAATTAWRASARVLARPSRGTAGGNPNLG